MNAILLYNPGAGRVRLTGDRIQRLLATLQNQGIRCEPVMTRPDAVALPPLDLSGIDLLLVYGGDGTVHNAVQWLAGTSVRLALLPAGTANVLAVELRIPPDLDAALQIAIGGRVREIYLGCAAGQYFHLMAGVGLDAHIINTLDLRLKKRFGIGAYWVSGFKAFFSYRLPEFRVEFEGESHRASFAAVANASRYGGGILLAPAADLSEPFLDLCFFTSRSKLRYVRYLAAAFRGRHVLLPDVICRKVKEVQISGPPLPVQMDGEIVARLPVSVSISSTPIRVMVPDNDARGSAL